MSKMSDVQRYAEAKDKNPRTVRRWCRSGKIRAQRNGDSWRIDPLEIQRAEIRKDLRTYFGPPTARNKHMFEATLFARGIDDPRDSEKLLRESPDKWRFLYLKYQHHEKAHLAADDPRAWLRFRIERQVQRLGYVPQVTELAKMLGVSVAQLYGAEPRLIKKLKRRFLHDPTAPTESQSARHKRNWIGDSGLDD